MASSLEFFLLVMTVMSSKAPVGMIQFDPCTAWSFWDRFLSKYPVSCFHTFLFNYFITLIDLVSTVSCLVSFAHYQYNSKPPKSSKSSGLESKPWFFVSYLVVQTTITKIPYTWWLKQQSFISHSTGSPRGPAWVVLGECHLPGLLRMSFLLWPHTVEIREGKQAPSVSSSKGTNPIMRVPPLLWPDYLQSLHLQIPSNWRLWFKHMHLGKKTKVQSIRERYIIWKLKDIC